MRCEELKPGYELVFTVTDYHDGPRKGIANYEGRPHFYECIFDTSTDEYSDVYRLTSLDAESFQLAMEDWEIWKRWEAAFHEGKTEIGTHPALTYDADRKAELKRILDKILLTDPTKAISRIGKFEVLGTSNLPKGVTRPLQVEWIQPPDLMGAGG
jgi:hypothetical protein